MKKKVVMIGASCRGTYAFAEPLLKKYQDSHQIVGVFDIDPHRMTVMNEYLGVEIPKFEDLESMFKETEADEVIITTTDHSHMEYIVAAMENGLDVICEKPLCIDASQCKSIVNVQSKHKHLKAVTAHNMRYLPMMYKVKELIDLGKIGTLRSMVFHEHLDFRHGASYFRRWNRYKNISGGLLVHKGSHCFDVMNWWADSKPDKVIAMGALKQYGPNASKFQGISCSQCNHQDECPEFYEVSTGNLRAKLYEKSSESGGYQPDLCLYSPEIDIEDHVTVGYSYQNGIQVSFDLCAYSTFEGVSVILEGSEGRLEIVEKHDTSPIGEGGNEMERLSLNQLTFFSRKGEIETIEIPEVEGEHGGADIMMWNDLFAGGKSKAIANLEDGIQAVLVGAAANISIKEKREVDVQSLLV